MHDRHLQGSFANVVVQRCSRHFEKARQRCPMVKHVPKGPAQAGVGFDFLLVQLDFHPLMKVFHDRPALRLMTSQSIRLREPVLLHLRFQPVNLPQALDDLPAFLGKILDLVHEIAPPVQEAMAQVGRA